jgi:hypothetical protein
MVNGHRAKVLFDTGTMRDMFIFEKFVSTNRIITENPEAPIFLKMAVKGSSSTINYRVKPIIQIGSKLDEITVVLVSSLKNNEIFLGIPYPNCH